MLATAGAAAGLLVGARWHTGAVARGYRWLGGAMAFWFAGLIITVLAGPIGSTAGTLSLADVPPLLGLATAAAGVMVLAEDRRDDTGPVLPGLADGYVMAVALLVIGWVVAFAGEFRRSGEHPQAFLLDLLHPLADLAVLGALLPVLTVAWRRVLVPYVGLMVMTFADSLGVGARMGGQQGILEQARRDRRRLPVRRGALRGSDRRALRPASLALGGGPELVALRGRRPGEPAHRVRRSPVTSAGAATIIAALSVVIAALVVIINGLASAPASGLALVIAGGAAVLVVVVRILCWYARTASRRGCGGRPATACATSPTDGDMVLICDLDGTISYVEPARLQLQLPGGSADRQAAERLRAPRGHRRGKGGDLPGHRTT